jgi:hypothetical protein
MADRHDNVVALPRPVGAGSRPLARIESLRVTIGLLDKLGYYLQEISSRSSWSAERWMIASTPLRMRLAGAYKRLNVLGLISAAAEEHDICWAFELDQVRLKAERRMYDIDVCLQTLQSAGISHAERVRQTEAFTFGQFELLELLGKIRHLLVSDSSQSWMVAEKWMERA